MKMQFFVLIISAIQRACSRNYLNIMLFPMPFKGINYSYFMSFIELCVAADRHNPQRQSIEGGNKFITAMYKMPFCWFNSLSTFNLSFVEAHFYAAVEHKFQYFCLFMQTVAGTWSAYSHLAKEIFFFEKFKFIKIRQT